MASEPLHAKVLSGLAAHLRAQREAILDAWRRSVDQDPHLTSASTLSRAQFVDPQFPKMLDTFEERLTAETGYRRSARRSKHKRKGRLPTGLQRWQQGYNPREAARDWGHLHLCLLAELEKL